MVGSGREQLERTIDLFRRFPAAWCIAGGWAIDLWLGAETRPHADVDISVFRHDLALLLASFPGWDASVAIAEQGRQIPLSELREVPAERHELLFVKGEERFEVLLAPRSESGISFRRNPAITIPESHYTLRSAEGWPVVCPEWQLLFKAKAPREKDEADFRACNPELGAEQRNWFASALTIAHPGHHWISLLRSKIPG